VVHIHTSTCRRVTQAATELIPQLKHDNHHVYNWTAQARFYTREKEYNVKKRVVPSERIPDSWRPRDGIGRVQQRGSEWKLKPSSRFRRRRRCSECSRHCCHWAFNRVIESRQKLTETWQTPTDTCKVGARRLCTLLQLLHIHIHTSCSSNAYILVGFYNVVVDPRQFFYLTHDNFSDCLLL